MGRGGRELRGEGAGRGVNRLVLLDNEAVQALHDPAHRKHRRVLDEVRIAAVRTARAMTVQVAVPTTVRVEAGWDRTAAAWVSVNWFRIADVPLDVSQADAAAGIAKRTRVSVADAHLGAVMQTAEADQITVLTSDPGDMRKVAEGRRVNVVAL
jgi:predicted nucleic acid-binding protein